VLVEDEDRETYHMVQYDIHITRRSNRTQRQRQDMESPSLSNYYTRPSERIPYFFLWWVGAGPAVGGFTVHHHARTTRTTRQRTHSLPILTGGQFFELFHSPFRKTSIFVPPWQVGRQTLGRQVVGSLIPSQHPSCQITPTPNLSSNRVGDPDQLQYICPMSHRVGPLKQQARATNTSKKIRHDNQQLVDGGISFSFLS
jgi:hypothetical protein